MENGNSKDFMEGMVIGLLAGIPFTIFTLSVGSEIFQALGLDLNMVREGISIYYCALIVLSTTTMLKLLYRPVISWWRQRRQARKEAKAKNQGGDEGGVV